MRFGKAKEDPRPARGGYAPGNYMVVCHGCNEVFVGDKRASQCADCAYSATKEPHMADLDEITSAVRSALGDFISPEKANALATALRPIHGREAVEAIRQVAGKAEYDGPEACFWVGQAADVIAEAFGVTEHD